MQGRESSPSILKVLLCADLDIPTCKESGIASLIT